jgi:hypothetical protein
MLWIHSKETIVPPFDSRDCLQPTNRSFHYLSFMLISETLYLFNTSTTLEKQPIALLVTHDQTVTLHDGRNDRVAPPGTPA